MATRKSSYSHRRLSSRKAAPSTQAQPATTRRPFYVVTDDAAVVGYNEAGEPVYGVMYYMARWDLGEVAYTSSTSYAEIAAEVEKLNRLYELGQVK